MTPLNRQGRIYCELFDRNGRAILGWRRCYRGGYSAHITTAWANVSHNVVTGKRENTGRRSAEVGARPQGGKIQLRGEV